MRHAIDEVRVIEPIANGNEIVVVRILAAHLQQAGRRMAAKRRIAKATNASRKSAHRALVRR